MTLSPEAMVKIGQPVASGATALTACTKRSSAALSRSSCGRTSRRARPSLVVQSSTSAGGRLSSDTGPACSMARTCASMVLSGGTTAAAAAARTSGVAAPRRSSTSASRRAEPAAAGSASACAAASRNEAAVALIVSFSSASVGGSAGSTSRTGATVSTASPTSISLFLWYSGTKLLRLTTRATSGSAPSRRASDAASASDGASTLMASSVQSGSLTMSCSVVIDSTRGLLRSSGLKSKRSSGSRARETTAAASAVPSTSRRWRWTKESTGPSTVKPTSARPPCGARSTVSRAGSSTMVRTKAMPMPRPATVPSSATPR